MKKLLVMMIALVSSMIAASALGQTNICLRDGETVYFSVCNQEMEDYTCLESECQLCANEVSNGVYCPSGPNSCNNSCKYIYDAGGNSTINLVSPQKYAEINPGDILFTAVVSLPETLSRCDLYINNVRKRYTLTPKETNTFTVKSMDEGTYEWRVECKEESEYGGDTIISNTRILYITQGDLAQEISLVNPDDEEVFTGKQEISFVFNVSGGIIEKINDCRLVLDDETVSSITNINLENEINFDADIGEHDWKIICNNGEYTSKTRSFTITPLDSSELEDRILILESWKRKMQEWKDSVIDALEAISLKINILTAKSQNHESRIKELEDKDGLFFENTTIAFPNYFRYLSSTDRKKMVCGYAIDRHLKQINDLGWNCTLTYRAYKLGERANCKCEKIQ